ncbi:hypothetical protein BaRGS_00031472 [Batillaria attramentaria]|uniref:Uncharacterized protein n=1 Tax=Batillaria attramentaria TaxID=370345 RepID=A0ABD0JRF3_9CAEN
MSRRVECQCGWSVKVDGVSRWMECQGGCNVKVSGVSRWIECQGEWTKDPEIVPVRSRKTGFPQFSTAQGRIQTYENGDHRLVVDHKIAVPSTCGCDFYLPPINRLNASHVLGLLEVVLCQDFRPAVVSVNLTFATVSGDVVHTLMFDSNQSARVSIEELVTRRISLASYGVKLTSTHDVSVYGHVTMETDVVTLLPLTAMTTSYLVPDLRTSDFEELHVILFSIVKRTSAVFLNVDSDVTILLQSNEPIGVMVLVTLPSSSPPPPPPHDVVTVASCGPDCSEPVYTDLPMAQDDVVGVEMVLPLSSMGRVFYLPVVHPMRTVHIVVSGQHNSMLHVNCEMSDVPGCTHHTLSANTSLLIEQPMKGLHENGHIWLSATSPVQVYIVTDVCVPGQDAECHVSAFFLPPLEEFFHCRADTSVGLCQVQCPSFWNSPHCLHASWLQAGSVWTSSSVTSDSRVWEVFETVSETSVNLTDICVTNNASYMQFRLDLTSPTFRPAGSRAVPLYTSCVTGAGGGGGAQGDGVDNDCDGMVDEELNNVIDDDGDGAVDEDTSSPCLTDVMARISKRGGLPGMADSRGMGFFDYEEQDSEMPLLAVITSLSVAIFAVIGVISIFLMMEIMSRRRQIRNTKIRPFVS